MIRRTTTLALGGLLLAGCATTAFKPTEVSPFGTPYAGLNENSYGPRSATQFRFCDPQDDYAATQNLSPDARAKLGEMTHSVAASVTSVVGVPLQGMTKIDSSIVDLGLAGFFRIPSDSNHPTVAVLSRSEDSIVFWHSAKMVRIGEVTTAAQAYCSKRSKPLLYRGSASRCPPAERGLSGMPVIHTYAISAFACAAR